MSPSGFRGRPLKAIEARATPHVLGFCGFCSGAGWLMEAGSEPGKLSSSASSSFSSILRFSADDCGLLGSGMRTFLYDVDVRMALNGIDVQHNPVRSDDGCDDQELPALSESREYGGRRVKEGRGSTIC
jgi:hypothetical protein